MLGKCIKLERIINAPNHGVNKKKKKKKKKKGWPYIETIHLSWFKITLELERTTGNSPMVYFLQQLFQTVFNRNNEAALSQ